MKKIIILSFITLALSLNAQAAETIYSLKANNPATSSVDIPINLSYDLSSTVINFLLLPYEVIIKPILEGFLT